MKKLLKFAFIVILFLVVARFDTDATTDEKTINEAQVQREINIASKL